jgi:benzoyl-CoA reductase/2-hydroxyglutaryl-CoA dehydratase subunit BcrC/BadD/HgdB
MNTPFTVGTVGRDVPLEVLDAAGARVVRLRGEPDVPLEAADRYLGVGLDPAIRSLLAVQLERGFAGLDAIVVGSDTDASQRLFYLLRELRRVEPGAGVPPVHLVDVLHRPRASSLRYSVRMVRAFAEIVEQWSGVVVTDDALRAAAEGRDAVRREARMLLPLRRSGRLTGVEFHELLIAGDTQAPSAHLAQLERAAATASERAPIERTIPVLLTGSGHDDARVVRAIEAAGALVVADDHPEGELAIGPLVAEQYPPVRSDPLEAIAARWHRNGPTPHRASIGDRAQHTAALARESGAQLIVAYVRERDDAPLWDAAEQERASGLPLVLLRRQAYGHVDEAALASALAVRHEGRTA